MRTTKEEKNLLEKLASGALDGFVGNTFVTQGYKPTYHDKLIKNGIPIFRKTGAGGKYFDGKENVKTAGKVVDTLCETVESKLDFLRRYGWLMKDPDVLKYSAKFKGKL